MLLVIDIGNTQTAFGLFFQGEPDGNWRIATRPEQTADELAGEIEGLIAFAGHRLSEVTGVCIASVVPAMTPAAVQMCEEYANAVSLVVGSDVKTGLTIDYNPPLAVGADRLANAVGGYMIYKKPMIIVDFGTATTFDVISENKVYFGGIIVPGVPTAAEAVVKAAARLSSVALEPPKSLVGKDTENSLKSGLIYGTAAMVDGLVARIKKEHKTDYLVLATGGLVGVLAPHCRSIDKVEPLLTLRGLKKIWELNV